MNIQEFIAKNNFPQINVEKESGVWHKLEDENFKGSFIHKKVKIGDKELLVVTVYNFRSGESVTERFGADDFTKSELAKITKIIKEPCINQGCD